MVIFFLLIFFKDYYVVSKMVTVFGKEVTFCFHFPFNFFQRLLCCFKEWSQFLERRSLFVFIVGESQVEKGNFLNLSLTSLSITFLLTIHKVSISILSDSNS